MSKPKNRAILKTESHEADASPRTVTVRTNVPIFGHVPGDVFTLPANVVAENPAHYFQIIPD